MKKLIIGLLFLVWHITCFSSTVNVKYVAVLYRHGDRTPVNPYPSDPWRNESLWPVKFGQLTNLGKQQHYALGQWIRARYSHLLPKEYDPTVFHVQSTDVDRTLMSAQANLAGMFPPEGKDVWDNNLIWQPVPVHTRREKDDEILAMKKECSQYKLELEKYVMSDEYTNELHKYKGLMSYLTKHTGTKIRNFSEINYIYDTLYIEQLNNFTIPNWTQPIYPKKMRYAACYSFKVPTATKSLARLKAGPLLNNILKNMKNALTKNNTAKVSIYSAHDDTVGNILNALGLFDIHCPSYTATVLFELYSDHYDTSRNYIRVLYKNSTEVVVPFLLPIPVCGDRCSMDAFVAQYRSIMPDDWQWECDVLLKEWMIGTVLYGAIFFFLLYRLMRLCFLQLTSSYTPVVIQPQYSDGVYEI